MLRFFAIYSLLKLKQWVEKTVSHQMLVALPLKACYFISKKIIQTFCRFMVKFYTGLKRAVSFISSQISRLY